MDVIRPGTLLTFMLCMSFALVQCSIVETPLGTIQGDICDSTPSLVFKGVPYAQPPKAQYRWRRTQPVQPFPNGFWNATVYGATCAQEYFSVTDPSNYFYYLSEDCLYLNIWVPPGTNFSDPVLPVKVFLHGGGLYRNSGNSSSTWNGCMTSFLEKQIFVTINYRVTAFGLLALPELIAEDEYNSTGNYALQDSREALRWVQSYIRYFGGDPSKVLVHGSSGGAALVYGHLVTRDSEGLFRALHAASGAGDVGYKTLADALTLGEFMVNQVNCSFDLLAEQGFTDRLECMRNRSIQAILDAVPDYTSLQNQHTWMFFKPVIDGSEFLDRPTKMIEKGEFNNVSFVVGSALNDGSMSVELVTDYDNNLTRFEDFIIPVFRKFAPFIRDAYNPAKWGDDEEAETTALSFLITDFQFRCPVRRVAAYLAKAGGSAYVYLWRSVPADDTTADTFGIYHESDLPYVFQWVGTNDNTGDGTDVLLSLNVSIALVDLADNGTLRPLQWSAFDPQVENVMLFDKGVELKDTEFPQNDLCLLFDLFERYYWWLRGPILPNLPQDEMPEWLSTDANALLDAGGLILSASSAASRMSSSPFRLLLRSLVPLTLAISALA